jgi:shikimate kinase
MDIKEKPVFLCGMMGAGKSAIGKALAEKLDVPFSDLDDLIEESEDLTIPEIFELHGEKYFREIERELLLHHAKTMNGVVALGGGSLQNKQLVDELKKHGWLLFLNPDREILLERLKKSNRRPMLKQMKDKQLEQRINSLLDERLPMYRQAHFSVTTGSGPISEAVDQIIKKFEQI